MGKGKKILSEYKKCSGCKKEFSRNNLYFHINNKNYDGLCNYCKDCNNAKAIEWSKKNRERYNFNHRENTRGSKGKQESNRKYREKNKNKVKELERKSKKKRYENDLDYRILSNLRSRMWYLFVNNENIKLDKTINLIGCSIDFLKKYLESLFTEGMTWENHSYYGWHIDHIRPCASFDLTKEEEQMKCCHYTNLQPLWYNDNFRKGSLYNGVHVRKKRLS